VISANYWGIDIDGSTASGNVVEGNYIGTTAAGTSPLGNEVYGVIFSANASNNTIGGNATGQGNTIAFNVAPGVFVQSGTGDAILSNSIYSNNQGIFLNGNANDAINTPNLITAGPNAITATIEIQGRYQSLPNASFMIQFFSNLAEDAFGFFEGQIYLGSTMVTTDSSGMATFAASLSTVDDPASVQEASTWITATATSQTALASGLNSGDTSEFSMSVLSQAVSVEFPSASFTVDSTAGIAMIPVQRMGNPTAQISVSYATSNGTAIAGRNYVAAAGILTLQTEENQGTFSVTILPSSSQSPYTTTVILTLSQPMGGATLGPISTAVLTIEEIPGPPSPPITLPQVTSEQLTVTGSAITGITLAFSEALNPSRAGDLGNYGFYVFSEGNRYTVGATYTRLSSAAYNSSTNTVTLSPSTPLPLNQFFEITIDGQASPLLNNGLVNMAGNQLAGTTGAAGTPLFLIFGAGTRLAYTDSGNNAVSLKLTKGGVMEMFLSPAGVVEQLQLTGTVAGKSVLKGTVKRGSHGTNRARLPAMGGSAGVKIRLKTPPFYFEAARPLDAKIAVKLGVTDKPESRAALRLSRRYRHA
jgi:hypothetical protein